MHVFKSKWFARFARKERISYATLCEAAKKVENGIMDANYGGGVIKQRIARSNEGKSGGYRAILLFRQSERLFFVYGFAKSDQENIDASDEQDFKELAKALFETSDSKLEKLVQDGKYVEIVCNA